MKAIILISEASLPLAKTLQRELPDTLIYTKNECEGCISITSCHRFIEEHFNDFDSIIFIGAMGICVRSIAGCIKNKYKDPAVVCVDSTGRFVISVLSGHVFEMIEHFYVCGKRAFQILRTFILYIEQQRRWFPVDKKCDQSVHFCMRNSYFPAIFSSQRVQRP